MTLFAEAGRQLVQAGKVERSRQYLDQIYETAHQSLKEMRLLIYGLRPPVLVREHLVGALHQRPDTVERRAGVEARLLVEELVDLPLPVEEELYRIAHEALNNALKHARAQSLNLHLRTVDGKLNRPSARPLTEDPLTGRELEVLKLVAQGFSNQEIAERLYVSERTVGTHVSNILGKPHLANRTQAALYALRMTKG